MEGDLIGRFILAVLITVLLHGVVSEMDELIHILGAVLLAARPHVPLAVKPESVVRIESPDADVELPAVVE
jgi:hypothetical protein